MSQWDPHKRWQGGVSRGQEHYHKRLSVKIWLTWWDWKKRGNQPCRYLREKPSRQRAANRKALKTGYLVLSKRSVIFGTVWYIRRDISSTLKRPSDYWGEKDSYWQHSHNIIIRLMKHESIFYVSVSQQ